MIRKKKVIINASLFLISVLIPILLVDISLKKLKLPNYVGRYLLITKLGIETDKLSGIKKYVPQSNYRQVAIYGDEIEYDYFFNTDREGFREINKCTIESNRHFIAFTGDSFTEGQGANTSWTKPIQEKLCDLGIKSNNMAMPSNSVIDMEKSLKFSYEELGARKAIIGLIANDFERGYSHMIKNKYCSTFEKFYSKSIDCGNLGSVTWWHIENDYNDRKLKSLALGKNNYGLYAYLKPLLSEAKNKTKTFLKKVLPVNLIKKISYGTKEQIIENNKKAALNIIDKFGKENVLFIILPTKYDAGLLTYKMKKKHFYINNFIASLKKEANFIDARKCLLKATHYHNKDTHPNSLGQLFLGTCIAKEVENIDFLETQSK